MTPVATNINMLSTAQDVAKKYHRQKPMQIFRVWITLNYMNIKYHGNFRYEDVTKLIGLGERMIKEYRDILQQENLLSISYRTVKDPETKQKFCLGQTVHMNELRDENKITKDADDLIKTYN